MTKAELETAITKKVTDDAAYRSRQHRPFFPGAILLIFGGTVLLLNNFGVLSWEVWGSLWRFWPVLLIFMGLNIILGRSLIAWIIINILGLVVLVWLLLMVVAASNQPSRDWLRTNFPVFNNTPAFFQTNFAEKDKEITVTEGEFTNITRRDFQIRLGDAQFNVQDSDSSNYLDVNAKFTQDFGEPEVQSSSRDSVLTTTLKTVDRGGFIFGVGGGKYQIDLGKPDLLTNIDIDLGAGTGTTNFSNLKIGSFKANLGAGQLNLVFSNNSLPAGKVEVHVGAGSATIQLPEGVPLEVKYQVGAGQLSIDGSKHMGKGTFTSVGFQGATVKVSLDVQVGAGRIEINTK